MEKRMFGGAAFMVNGKMCVTASRSRIKCRIDPRMQSELYQYWLAAKWVASSWIYFRCRRRHAEPRYLP